MRLSEASLTLGQDCFLTGVSLDEQDQVTGGTYADIYKGTYRTRPVALKALRRVRAHGSDGSEKVRDRTWLANVEVRPNLVWQRFYREIAILQWLKHDNICCPYGVAEKVIPPTGAVCLVLPWMKHGSIENYMRTRRWSQTEVARFVSLFAALLFFEFN